MELRVDQETLQSISEIKTNVKYFLSCDTAGVLRTACSVTILGVARVLVDYFAEWVCVCVILCLQAMVI